MDNLMKKITSLKEMMQAAEQRQANPQQERFRLVDGSEVVFMPRLERSALALNDGIAMEGDYILSDGRKITVVPGSIVDKISYDRLSLKQITDLQNEKKVEQEKEAKIRHMADYFKNK